LASFGEWGRWKKEKWEEYPGQKKLRQQKGLNNEFQRDDYSGVTKGSANFHCNTVYKRECKTLQENATNFCRWVTFKKRKNGNYEGCCVKRG